MAALALTATFMGIRGVTGERGRRAFQETTWNQQQVKSSFKVWRIQKQQYVRTSLAASKPIETVGKLREKHTFSSADSPDPMIRESDPPLPACVGQVDPQQAKGKELV